MQHIQPAATRDLIGTVNRRSIRDIIAVKLARLIASGVLAEGDELPGERELAASLNVSRETIRGAIGILATHGILRVTHGARTMVSSTDVANVVPDTTIAPLGGRYDLDAVHEARVLVETRIARDAARNVTDAALSRLAGSIKAQTDCGDDAVRFLLCDREFHALLYKASGNDALFDIAMGLYNHMLDHRRRIVARDGSIAQSIGDHRAIVAALGSRNPDQAAGAVIDHANRIFTTTRAFLAEGGRAD